MHYSFHRRSMLALAALPLASAAAHATQPADESVPVRTSERVAPEGDTPVELTAETMVGKKLRVVQPGSMMTMDYSTDRVNIEVDENGKIVRIFIG